MKVADPALVVLGLEIERNRENRTMRLRQRGSIDAFLHEHVPNWETIDVDEFAMIPAPPPRELCARDMRLADEQCTELEKATYNRMHGQLNWILHTSPDFMNAVHDRSYHLQNPSHLDLARMYQIASCMARIRRLDMDGLTIGGREGVKVLSTVDTSHAGNPELRGTTGSTIHMAHSTGSIMSSVRRHTLTTDSAMASEGVGGHLQARKVIGLRYFCGELGFPQAEPSDFYMDNEPFIKTIINRTGCSERSKWILIRYNILKEAWEQDEIDLKHLNSENMVSDILSKNTPRELWYRLRDVLLGNSPILLDTV
jgi:hypothetical protein